MSNSIAIPSAEELATMPLVDEATLPEHKRRAYRQRVSAVQAVVAGLPIYKAASVHFVDRSVLTRVLGRMSELDIDGRPIGYRACIPNYAARAKHIPTQPPLKARPGAFDATVRAVSTVAELIEGFKGNVGTNRRSRAFEKLHEAIVTELRRLGFEDRYPLNTPDLGRRVLALRLLKLQRARISAQEPDDQDVEEVHLDSLLKYPPLARVELDEHSADVDWYIGYREDTGVVVLLRIRKVRLIAVVDAHSRAICGWLLVLGRDFRRRDILQTLAQMVVAWEPLSPTAPGLVLLPGAAMPSALFSSEAPPRARLVALDNHMAHISPWLVSTMARNYGGVLNHGLPHQPRNRPHIELLFKQLEEMIFRQMAGGYAPSPYKGEVARTTTALDPKDYPIEPGALQQFMSVIAQNYNAAHLSALGHQSPLDVIRRHLVQGGWDFGVPEAERDASALFIQTGWATIRGNRREGKQPYVEYLNAKYRCPQLLNRWDLVKKRFRRTWDIRDLRTMTLWEDQTVFAVLRARPPWHATPHDANERRMVNKAMRESPKAFKNCGDALAAFRGCVRAGRPPELVVAPRAATPPRPASELLAERFQKPSTSAVPLTGWVQLGPDGQVRS